MMSCDMYSRLYTMLLFLSLFLINIYFCCHFLKCQWLDFQRTLDLDFVFVFIFNLSDKVAFCFP